MKGALRLRSVDGPGSDPLGNGRVDSTDLNCTNSNRKFQRQSECSLEGRRELVRICGLPVSASIARLPRPKGGPLVVAPIRWSLVGRRSVAGDRHPHAGVCLDIFQFVIVEQP
jgi:hypothetical protein